MPQAILRWFEEMMRVARDVYGVDPIVFLVLYLGCAPFWYLSLFRTLRAVAGGRANQIMLWSAVFMIATVLPFLYVMLFGRNIPWWVYALIAVLVLQGIHGLITKIRKGRHTASA